MLEHMTIFEKSYQLLLWIYPAVQKFPKSQRFVLGQQVESVALDILRGIIRANASRNKMPILIEISTDLDTLRILLRLCKDMKYISIRQYAFVQEQVNEVGKLLGGWIKSQTV